MEQQRGRAARPSADDVSVSALRQHAGRNLSVHVQCAGDVSLPLRVSRGFGHEGCGDRAMKRAIAAALVAGSLSLHAQEPVVGASDPEALFHSSDPKLNTNKQAAYHIVKDLLEAGHWERSEEHTSELQSRLHLVCR